jgi:hypothetical protein
LSQQLKTHLKHTDLLAVRKLQYLLTKNNNKPDNHAKISLIYDISSHGLSSLQWCGINMLQNYLLLQYGNLYLNRTITPIHKEPRWTMLQNKRGLLGCLVLNPRGWTLTWFPQNPHDHNRINNWPPLKRSFNSLRMSILLQDDKNLSETLMKTPYGSSSLFI